MEQRKKGIVALVLIIVAVGVLGYFVFQQHDRAAQVRQVLPAEPPAWFGAGAPGATATPAAPGGAPPTATPPAGAPPN
ncbi:MAG TPA: hypothetical protein VLH79_10935 [Chthonomonadales bacterium]|nr:hypothetical protein [Chthonomonadales bacterium]